VFIHYSPFCWISKLLEFSANEYLTLGAEAGIYS